MNKLRSLKMKVDKKLLGVGVAVACAAPSFAQESASNGALQSLDNLQTALGTLNTKAEAIMVALGVLTLTITIGVVVMKLTKKGQRGG